MSLKAVSTQSECLDWAERPLDLQKKIADDFFVEHEKKDTCYPPFGFSDTQLGLFNLDEFLLFKKTILEAYPDQKEFNALHIGAYNFTWSMALAKFIEKQTDLPKDVKINIYGIRGEKHMKFVKGDRCTIYNQGAFKVEELFSKFKENGFDLENKVDLAISYGYLRGLNDPVGTVVQTYNLLRPKSGWLLTDGFIFLCNGEKLDTVNGNRNMTQLFIDMKAPFLTKKYDGMRSLNLFMLKRPDDKPCRLPMSYSGSYHLHEQEAYTWKVASSHITRFTREPQLADREVFSLPHDYNIVSGDKSMFDRLRAIEGLFFGADHDLWAPLQAKDEHFVWTPLQTAVAEGNYDQVVELLDGGADVDEKCRDGSWKNTALHLSVQKMGAAGEKRYEIFQLILNRSKYLNARNVVNHSPLHVAVMTKNDRAFQDLIAAGAYIHDQYPNMMTCAIDAQNMSAIKFFIQNKVKMSDADQTRLQGPAFIGLREFVLEQNGVSRKAWQQ